MSLFTVNKSQDGVQIKLAWGARILAVAGRPVALIKRFDRQAANVFHSYQP